MGTVQEALSDGCRDVLCRMSQDCLQVRPHHVLDPADLRIVEQGCELEGLPGFVEFQYFEHHVHAYLVPEFEAVGDGFFRGVDVDWHPVDPVLFDASRVRRTRKPVHEQRRMVQLRPSRLKWNGHEDSVRDLCGHLVEGEGGNQTDDRIWDAQCDSHQIRIYYRSQRERAG